MNYGANMSAANVSAANVSGGANTHYPVAGASYAPFTNVGSILVLFILLVIISRLCLNNCY